MDAVITLLNQKGGVGKTTASGTIAAGMATLGKRVLLIDADPQGNAADMFGLDAAPHFHDFVLRPTPVDVLMVPVPPERYAPQGKSAGTLDLMPGNYETRSINDGTLDLLVLLKKLIPLQARFDVVIIDTQPTPALLHSVIVLASTHVIFPTELSRPALIQVRNTWNTLQENSALRVSKGLPPVELAGIVPWKTRLNTGIQAKHHRDLGNAKTFRGKLWEPVALRGIWEEAATAQKSIFAYAPTHEVTEETAWRLVNKVMEVLYGEPVRAE